MADSDTERVKKVLEDLGSCQSFHDDLVNKVDRNERAFRSVLERSSDAAQWRSQLHPPWIQHIVETTVASLMEDRLSFKVAAAPRMYDPGE